MEKEIEAGQSETMQFFVQSPVILKSHLSVTMHIRNLKIDKFDFKMAQKLGPGLFQLSRWAQERSLLKNSNKSPELTLDLISPCNNALPEDRYTNNSWIGYPGQVVPSNNFIGGPICLDENGDMITRSCGLNIPNEFKVISISTFILSIFIHLNDSIYIGMLQDEGKKGRAQMYARFPTVR